MYNFIDVNEVSEGNILPSEALQINGEYIENIIPGYRTLNVVGREALSPEVATYTTGGSDGSRIKSSRFPERIITITYQLMTKSNTEFREAYNKLAAVLNVKEAELIFNDEQDKFFIGTPCGIGSVKPGLNAVVGEFEILCADPFKYSVTEYEAKPTLDGSSILIDYNGTYKSRPTLKAAFYNEEEVNQDGIAKALTGTGDCGYVAFFNEKEKIIQLGNPEEVDTESYPKSQTLVNQSFTAQHSWGSAAQALWTTNGAPFVLPTTVKQTGAVAIGAASYDYPEDPPITTDLLKVTSTASTPKVSYTLTAVASGRTADSVNVVVTVTSKLGASKNWLGPNIGLKGSIQLGGEWHEFDIKRSLSSTSSIVAGVAAIVGVKWTGDRTYTASVSVKVEDLEAATTVLDDVKFKVERTDDIGKAGIISETKCSDIQINKYVAPVPSALYLTPSSYASEVDKWHGPTITRIIPADAAGESGAENFTLTYSHKMCIGKEQIDTRQKGAFQVRLLDAAGDQVAGLRILKNQDGKTATVEFNTGVASDTKTMDMTYSNGGGKTTTITKNVHVVTFNIGGVKASITDPSIVDKKVTQIVFAFEQYSVTDPLAFNGLYWVKFVKNNCDTFKDIPNKFSANDVVEADCKNGDIYLNGISAPELGALGNDWETFCLTPGLNQIGVSYSDWVDDAQAPKFTVRYREVFL